MRLTDTRKVLRYEAVWWKAREEIRCERSRSEMRSQGAQTLG